MILNKIKKLDSKAKIFCSIIFFIIFEVIIIFLVIYPFINKIRSLKENTINQIEKSVQEEALRNSIIDLDKKLKEIDPYIKDLENIFIHQSRDLEFITTLEFVANKNTIQQKINLEIPEENTEESYKKIPLTLDVNGSYNNFVKYLIDLESLDYLININIINVNSSGISPGASFQVAGQDNTGNISAKIVAETFWK